VLHGSYGLRLYNDINMSLKNIGWGSVKWIYPAQGREEIWGFMDTVAYF
jgi:hypothetical protein